MASDAEQSVVILMEMLETWGLSLSQEQRQQFETYAAMLVEWNATRMNLTRLTSPHQVAVLHFLDSLAVTRILPIPKSASLLDIGTGAGFPGLPLKILRPDLHLTLLEATMKKLVFCRAVADALGLNDVETIHGRAEDAAGQGEAARHDLVTARAVAPVSKLLGWAVPYLRDSRATFVAWKGARAAEEVREASDTARSLGVTLRLEEVALPPVNGEETKHHFVMCQMQKKRSSQPS